MSRRAFVLAVVFVFGCSSARPDGGPSGGSSSGDGGAMSGDASPGMGGGPTPIGMCSVSGGITAMIPVSATCNDLSQVQSTGYVISILGAQSKPTVGGNFGLHDRPLKGKAYTLHDAFDYSLGGKSTYSSFVDLITDKDGMWMAGDLTKAAPDNGAVSLQIDECNAVGAHGSLTATLKPYVGNNGKGDVIVTCTF